MTIEIASTPYCAKNAATGPVPVSESDCCGVPPNVVAEGVVASCPSSAFKNASFAPPAPFDEDDPNPAEFNADDSRSSLALFVVIVDPVPFGEIVVPGKFHEDNAPASVPGSAFGIWNVDMMA